MKFVTCAQAGDQADLAAVLSIVEESGEKFDNALVELALTQVGIKASHFAP
jgi:hypothetical protein